MVLVIAVVGGVLVKGTFDVVLMVASVDRVLVVVAASGGR